jgi:hypothetical protein
MDAVDVSRAALRPAAEAAAAVGAPSWVLSAAHQAAVSPAAAPRGRLEQHLLDLGVRDPELLRQGAELDETAQRILSEAPRSRPGRPQPHAEVAPELAAADAAAEPAWSAEATADEPEIDDGLELGLD